MGGVQLNLAREAVPFPSFSLPTQNGRNPSKFQPTPEELIIPNTSLNNTLPYTTLHPTSYLLHESSTPTIYLEEKYSLHHTHNLLPLLYSELSTPVLVIETPVLDSIAVHDSLLTRQS